MNTREAKQVTVKEVRKVESFLRIAIVNYSRPVNSHTKYAEILCELSEHVNHPSLFLLNFVNGGKLCTGQSCKLSRRCELARIKLSGLTVDIL